jgi:signal transduction histidine kinase
MTGILLAIGVGISLAILAIRHWLRMRISSTTLLRSEFTLRRERFDVDSLIVTAVDKARRRATVRNVHIIGSSTVDVPVIADPNRVMHVLSKLIDYAVDVSRPGETITVTAKRSDGVVRFAIRDAGPGLTPSQVTHLFDRYHPDADSDHELHDCRRIVEAHRGRSGASSVVGEGCTLWFTIPTEPSL